MLSLNDIKKRQIFNLKKSKIKKINSVFCSGNKNVIKIMDNHSYVISQPYNYINYMDEESKVNINNYRNSDINTTEKEINNLKKKLVRPIKIINNSNNNLKKERRIVSEYIEENNIQKNNCIFLNYKNNSNFNKKKLEYKPININKFVNEINSFLLPNDKTFENLTNLINYRIIYKESLKNIDLCELLMRNINLDDKLTSELFYRYIINRTFKEVLKMGLLSNILMNKNAIKEEYNRQINELKKYLKLYNKENKDLFDRYLELLDKSSFKNLIDNRKSPKKEYKIINILSHRKHGKNNKNNSTDNIFFHFHNFAKASSELKKYNIKYKNQQLNKNKFKILLSLLDNKNFIEKTNNIFKNNYTKMFQIDESNQNSELENKKRNKNSENENKINEINRANSEIFTTKIIYPSKNKLSSIIKKQKKNIINNKENLNSQKDIIKNKSNNRLKTENINNMKIKEFNFFLDQHNKNNKSTSKNEDILNIIFNKKKEINFSNILLQENINKISYNQSEIKTYKFDYDKGNKDRNPKEETEANINYKSSNENNKTFNHSLNLENGYNEKDLNLKAQHKYKSSFLKTTPVGKNLFPEKFVIDKKFFKKEKVQKKSIIQYFSQLFYKEAPSIEKEKQKEKEKKYKLLYTKKLFIKKKRAETGKRFKDFMKDDIDEENEKLINNKHEDDKKKEDIKDKIKDTKKKIDENLSKEEKKLESQLNSFKDYINRLKNMSKEEFIKDTLRFVKYDE